MQIVRLKIKFIFDANKRGKFIGSFSNRHKKRALKIHNYKKKIKKDFKTQYLFNFKH